MRSVVHICIGVLVCSLAFPLYAATLVMKNGDQLTGEIVSKDGNTLKFKTSYAEEIEIAWDQVDQLKTDKAILVVDDEGRVIKHRISSSETDGGDDIRYIQLSEVDMINPEPWRLGEGWLFTGRVMLGLKYERGNNVKDEVDFDGNMVLRNLENRFTAEWNLENDTTIGVKTKDKWSVELAYDQFIGEKQIYGVAYLGAASDQFAELELRIGGRPGVGYQFYDRDELQLRLDAAAVHVEEDYLTQPDTSYWGAGWRAYFEQQVLKESTRFYFENRGVWSMEDTDRYFFKTWIGLRKNLYGGIVGALEAKHEYESQPAPGAVPEDWTYALKFGYEW